MKPGNVIVAGLTAAAAGIYHTVERATRPEPDPPCFSTRPALWCTDYTGGVSCGRITADPSGLCDEHTGIRVWEET